MLNALNTAPFRQRIGPMTRQLLLEPGNFGLGKVPANSKPVSVKKAICGYCATGCGLKIHLNAEGQAVNLTPDPDHPVNIGMACPKGWEALTPLAAHDRATHPLLQGRPVDWPKALEAFCDNFKAIQSRHGKESVAFLSTGQIMVEDMAFLGSLAKFGMGMIHGDGNTRQCMATSVAAYKQSFGFDAPPFTYADFEESDVLVFIGSNPAIAHPIMWQRVAQNPHSPEIIVIDPRATETAMAATQHLAILPKTDLLLLYCIAHDLICRGCVDSAFVEAHTTGFNEFADFIQDYDPRVHLPAIGLRRVVFDRCVDAIARGKRVSMWWTMGVNQGHQATRTAQAIINLCLMTGNIGRPGTGPNSITGQCNAMGSRLFSNTTNLLGGHDFTNAAHREKVASALDIPADSIPSQNSWAYDQIIEGIHQGKIKGLWMIATNAAHSWIHQDTFAEAAKKLEFFVVQDMYATTETARLANLILPAAGWGEKEGTFINAERRLGVSRKVSSAPGQALADFSIFRLIADAWGCGNLFRSWTSPEAVFRLLKKVSAGQPCDITGMVGYEMLDGHGGLQWPFTGSDLLELPAKSDGQLPSRSERRLFADGKFFTPDQRARFLFEPPQNLPEAPDEAFQFVLLTGRGSSAQWHTETRTGKSAILRKLYPDILLVELHPEDAARLRIADYSQVSVETRRGNVRARARVTTTIQPGQLFLPMHHPEVNRLTLAVFDPHSRQPGYKACAATIRPT
ncbi:MAG: molybdopterin-dependent oxidoreductase [Verrucomicrobiaceae bacterium]|nr:molybdopterin-dependent oxidoreductase [Verrucomicrobiaceae bacterium]